MSANKTVVAQLRNDDRAWIIIAVPYRRHLLITGIDGRGRRRSGRGKSNLIRRSCRSIRLGLPIRPLLHRLPSSICWQGQRARSLTQFQLRNIITRSNLALGWIKFSLNWKSDRTLRAWRVDFQVSSIQVVKYLEVPRFVRLSIYILSIDTKIHTNVRSRCQWKWYTPRCLIIPIKQIG